VVKIEQLLAIFGLTTCVFHMEQMAKGAENLCKLQSQLDQVGDLLAAKTLELESLKKKIVEKAKTPPILKAKTAAEIRRLVEQENEREFEEQANGI
jgi:Skp family chaperone for outer membrane proteins